LFNFNFYPPDNSGNKHKFKIYLTGADPYQWALREDYNQTAKAINSFSCLMSLRRANIIHSVYWETLKNVPFSSLIDRVVVCNLSGAWQRYEDDFGSKFLNVARRVDVWVVRSRAAEKQLHEKGMKVFFIPYTVNTSLFHPLEKAERKHRREKFKIPENAYVIGNFMRDSTAGATSSPKLVKGPDIFADIVSSLHRKGHPVHVLLAGPRRHWMCKTLDERGVPYNYAGYKVGFDDMRINTLKRKKLNVLYNMLDLSLVTSRSEAGPHAILEAAAAQCPQASTKVGIAPDVLPPENIYETVEGGVNLIEKDIESRFLRQNVENIYNQILTSYTPEAVSPLYKELYEKARQV